MARAGACIDCWRACWRAWLRYLRTASGEVAIAPGADDGARPPDNAAACLERILASTTYGEAELDKAIACNVTIWTLPPATTGFPAWSRHEDHVSSDADHDRGHADWVVPNRVSNNAPRILYCHGGGYEWYSPQDVYRPVTSRLAADTGMPVLCFDYRLIPEFRHPAQLEDGLQALRWIAANGPEGPGRASKIFLAGDSAGGGLALALALAVRDGATEGVQVAGVVVVSPMTDLTCRGGSYTSRRWRDGGGPLCDPIFRGEDPVADSLEQIYKLLGRPGEPGVLPLDEPSISVLHAELHDLPPAQIHCGDLEVMRSDAVDFAEKARAAGSPVEVVVWPRMWHTFTQYTEGCGGPGAVPLDEAVRACAQIAGFLKGLA